MTLFFGLMPTATGLNKVVFALLGNMFDDRLMQRILVAFQRQNKVRFQVDDLCRNRFLRAHRIDGDDRALNVHKL